MVHILSNRSQNYFYTQSVGLLSDGTKEKCDERRIRRDESMSALGQVKYLREQLVQPFGTG